MSDARNAATLRRILYDRLPDEAFDRVNWTTVTRAMARLREHGWTPHDVASQILGDYGQGDPAALVVTRIQRLNGPPPRDSTPTPPPLDHQQLTQARAAAAHVDHTAWAARIRAGTTRPRPKTGAAA